MLYDPQEKQFPHQWLSLIADGTNHPHFLCKSLVTKCSLVHTEMFITKLTENKTNKKTYHNISKKKKTEN